MEICAKNMVGSTSGWLNVFGSRMYDLGVFWGAFGRYRTLFYVLVHFEDVLRHFGTFWGHFWMFWEVLLMFWDVLAKSSQKLQKKKIPQIAQNSQKLPKLANSSLKYPKVSKFSQKYPKVAKSSQK